MYSLNEKTLTVLPGKHETVRLVMTEVAHITGSSTNTKLYVL